MKNSKQAAPRSVALIKNEHTDAQLDAMEEHWANHPGPRMTLADVLAIEKARAEKTQSS